MLKVRIFLLILATLVAAGAEAAIYKCVDAQGHVTFTDVRCRGGSRVDTGEAAVPAKAASRPRSVTPQHFPRIDAASQKRRDDLRRQVLEDEIASEASSAAAARQQLARLVPGSKAGTSLKPNAGDAARIDALRDALARHEQNLAAIQRELANLR